MTGLCKQVFNFSLYYAIENLEFNTETQRHKVYFYPSFCVTNREESTESVTSSLLPGCKFSVFSERQCRPSVFFPGVQEVGAEKAHSVPPCLCVQ